MSLPPIPDPSETALFLDFDGTIVEIAAHPDLVAIDPEVIESLASLQVSLNGALAIITGRDIAVIDRLLAPLHLPVAGVHGAMRRDSSGRILSPLIADEFFAIANERLSLLQERESGLVIERKLAGFALHYRDRPEMEGRCVELVEALANRFVDIEVKRGKMVVEAKFGRGNKGTAVMDFMAEPPFHGRRPIFAGDDLTDEDAFLTVNALGGISIKVGEGASAANYRIATIAEMTGWLAHINDRSSHDIQERT